MGRTGTLSFLVVVSAVVLGLIFLSSGPVAWATPNQSASLQTVPAPEGGGVATATPNDGGSASTTDGKTTLSVPPGAVTTTTEVSLEPVQVADVPASPTGRTILGAFNIQAYIGGQIQSNFTFNQAVSICTKITQADLNAVKGDVTKFVIMRYDANLQAWVELPTSVDLVAMTACATVRSLSQFALAVKAVVTPGDASLATPSGWWLVLGAVGAFMVLSGGFALRRSGTKRNS